MDLVRPVNSYNGWLSRDIQVTFAPNQVGTLNSVTDRASSLAEIVEVRRDSLSHARRLSKKVAYKCIWQIGKGVHKRICKLRPP